MGNGRRRASVCLLCVVAAFCLLNVAHAEGELAEVVVLVVDATAPVAGTDALYVTAVDRLYAVDPHRKTVTVSVELPSGDRSAPRVLGDAVLLVTSENTLLRVHGATGQVRRVVDLNAIWPGVDGRPQLTVTTSPELVLLSREETIALRPGDGSVAWRLPFPASDPIPGEGGEAFCAHYEAGIPMLSVVRTDDGQLLRSGPCGSADERFSAEPGPVLAGDLLLVCIQGRIRGFQRETLGLAWETAVGPGGYQAPSIVGQNLAVAGFVGHWSPEERTRLRGCVTAFDLATGQERWRKSLASGVRGVLRVGNLLVIDKLLPSRFAGGRGLARGELGCVSAVDGNDRWRVRMDPLSPVAGPVAHGNTVWMKCVDPTKWRPPSMDRCDVQPNTPSDYYLVPIEVSSGTVGQPVKLEPPEHSSRSLGGGLWSRAAGWAVMAGALTVLFIAVLIRLRNCARRAQ